MLTVPASIKALYQIDGVRRNFRIQFPNGEFSNINGDHIVQETVKFTESLCSQSTFKFGLAEASVLEFEAVDIPNIFGKIIDAGIEIDISSLSAADISTIEAGTWNGTLVKAAQSDLGYGYFRIPYGRFQVASCPRNADSKMHRQVTAYSLTPDYQDVMNRLILVTVVPAYDLTDATLDLVTQGLLEVSALFLKADRLGGQEIFRLKDTSPISIGPSSYQSVWWDEYDVDNIGTVSITYRDGENENTTDFSVGNGTSKYDMTNNELLKHLVNADYASVTSLLAQDFQPHLRLVDFTPIDMTMQGWPWLEAGDALKITAVDGTIVNTYALNVEMSGIQNIEMTITADGGTIIEEE